MRRVLVAHVREALEELSDRAMQRDLWLASEGPRVGSFVEAVEQLYDDSGLIDVLHDGRADEELGPQAANLLRELVAVLESIDDRTVGPAELIDSLAMERVRTLAREALNVIPPPVRGA